jgi:hypothetical protein
MNMTLHIAVAGLVLALGAGIQAGSSVAQDNREVTVRGCVERDAAARSAVYKLVAGDRLYRLQPAGKVDLAGALGHTVDATGTVSTRDTPRGRPESVLAVTALKTVANSCS